MDNELARAAVLIGGGFLGFSLLYLAIAILTGNRNEYNRNRKLSGGPGQALRGDVPTLREDSRDYRVAAGLTLDLRSKKLLEQGKLSEEAVMSVLKR